MLGITFSILYNGSKSNTQRGYRATSAINQWIFFLPDHNIPVGSPAAKASASLSQLQHVTFVFAGYRPAPEHERRLSNGLILPILLNLWLKLTTESYKESVRIFRDHYANPRSPAYMWSRVQELLEEVCPNASVHLIAAKSAIPNENERSWRGTAPRLTIFEHFDPTNGPSVDMRDPPNSATVIVYPDAIGLGQVALENTLCKAIPGQVFAYNGRKRLFELTPSMRRKLRLRRFLAETRAFESALGYLFIFSNVFSLRRHKTSAKN